MNGFISPGGSIVGKLSMIALYMTEAVWCVHFLCKTGVEVHLASRWQPQRGRSPSLPQVQMVVLRGRRFAFPSLVRLRLRISMYLSMECYFRELRSQLHQAVQIAGELSHILILKKAHTVHPTKIFSSSASRLIFACFEGDNEAPVGTTP